MSTIVTRYGKGAPLTWLEADENFTNLNNDKVESSEVVLKTGNTGSAVIPTGSTAERDSSPTLGLIRYNTDSNSWEGWGATGWSAIGSGGGGTGSVDGITSSDPDMITIDNSIPSIPNLSIQSNIADGMVKLDAAGKIPNSLLPVTPQTFLGTFDASDGDNPTQKFPSQTFNNGDLYIIGVSGTISIYDPGTFISAATVVDVGDGIVYTDNGIDPTGWYHVAMSVTSVIASNVSISPAISGLSATNVQDGLSELESHAIAYALALG